MWVTLKTAFFCLLDLFVLFWLIKLLFRGPLNFLRALWEASKSPFLYLILKDKSKDRQAVNKVSATVVALGFLVWIEHLLFY